jgi:hypothetical protein
VEKRRRELICSVESLSGGCILVDCGTRDSRIRDSRNGSALARQRGWELREDVEEVCKLLQSWHWGCPGTIM